MVYTDKIYGEAVIKGPFAELIGTDAFQRLKRIHQGGAVFIADPKINHTRYEHSIGVMLLIRQLGGNEESQIAGLLHDISHTAFSHLIDYVLEYDGEDYHEERLEEVLNQTEVKDILNRNRFSLQHFSNLEKFTILNYPLPFLSADRIDYTLRDLYQLEAIKKEEIEWFIAGLILHENRILVKDKTHAKWFQEKYKVLVNDYFNSDENKLVNTFMTSLIQKYYKQGDITLQDFHQDDDTLIKRLESLTKQDIKVLYQEWKTKTPLPESIKIKQRTVDPEILSDGQIKRLSETIS